ncbi:MAG: beta-lactamase family protein [Cytophagaceae bacterium]|nr:beta-lactamase family protein [Gemmatimonadaceae bacterium]
MIRQLILASVVAGACSSPIETEPSSSLADFRDDLNRLRVSGHIESISALIAKDQSVTWSASLGAATVTDTTVFHLASLTKPFASTVILQLVDEGKVSLDDPVSNYGIVLTSSGTVRVRHLMSHTSEGVPGSRYAYNGDRFSLLDSVIRRAAGKPFAAAVQERIIVPLGLTHTAATPQSAAFAESGLDKSKYLANVAPGYTWTNGAFVPTAYQTSFSTAAGLTASARDYAAFSMALDRGAFLTPATKMLAWTPATSPSGQVFPYGLGWFVTDYKGVRIIWHYGYWTASSTLILKVPSQNLTFVLLANTDGLSAPYPLASGRLDASPWARAFLETFVIAKLPPG